MHELQKWTRVGFGSMQSCHTPRDKSGRPSLARVLSFLLNSRGKWVPHPLTLLGLLFYLKTT